jgi:glycine cleavage system transcriptional repressor
MSQSFLVIATLGADRPGLVRELSEFLAERAVNIDDSRMAILGAEFGSMLLLSGAEDAIARVECDLPELERRTGFAFLKKRTKSPEEHRRGELRSVVVTVESFDREGIVRAIASALNDLGANIVSLETAQWNAPFTGATLFRIEVAAEVPKSTTVAAVRARMDELATNENLDIEVKTA